MEMNDREMLELAAKAAGIAIIPCTCSDERWPFKHDESISGLRGHWNPLMDDGDAMRLAVKLLFSISVNFDGVTVSRGSSGYGAWIGTGICADEEKCRRAVRIAIVRAAAEIGRSKE